MSAAIIVFSLFNATSFILEYFVISTYLCLISWVVNTSIICCAFVCVCVEFYTFRNCRWLIITPHRYFAFALNFDN